MGASLSTQLGWVVRQTKLILPIHRHPQTNSPSGNGLDQSTRNVNDRRNGSLTQTIECLIAVDRFRWP